MLNTLNENLILNEKQKLLLKMINEGVYDTEKIKFILKDLDIANENFYFLLSLGVFASKHNWKVFEKKTRNWIMGIVQQTRLRNAIYKKVAHLIIQKITNEIKGCTPILIKDLPMLFNYDLCTPRVCYDIPIIVNNCEQDKARQLSGQVNKDFDYPFCLSKIYTNYLDYGLNNAETRYIKIEEYDVLIPLPEETLLMLYSYYVDRIVNKKDRNLTFKACYDGIILNRYCSQERLHKITKKTCNANDIKELINIVNSL